MAAGFEAKARITVDTSQLVSASREAARSIGTLTAASREASASLTTMERAGRSAAQSLRPFVSMMQSAANDSRNTASANQQLSQGLRENAQAFSTAANASQSFSQTQVMTAGSIRRMAREIVDTDNRLEQIRRAMDVGADASGELDNSYRVLRQRLQELRQAYDALDTEQREAVRGQMNLITAQRDASQAARDADAAVRDLNKQRMEQVRIAVRAAQEEAKAAAAADRAAQKQREVAQSAQQAAQAQTALGRAASAMADGMDQGARSAGGLDGSLWALRSSVGEIEGMLYSLQNTAIQVTQAMWTNFSTQEMAIAQISRVSQATVTELDEIVGSVRQMSREIPIAFDELGRIAMLGSQVGVSNEALANFTETVALFSATSEVSAEDTSTLLARIMQMADVPEDEVMNLGAAVAYLGSNSAATDAEILTTIESIATIGNQAGLSETAIIGLGGAMASLRIRPELARGAMQRVFNQLEQGARGSGNEMERLSEITQMNQDALVGLLEEGENSDQFFFTIIEGLNRMHEEGTNLVPVLREMGIINTRDVDVLARLAANWDVLSKSVGDANTAFSEGTYLYEESDRIFNTLTARVQIMTNAWQEFMFNAFEAVAPFVTKLVEATTAALRFADSIGAAPVVGFAALALAGAAALGTLGIAATTVTRGILALRTAQIAVQRSMMATTTTTVANTAATAASATAQRGLAASTTATAAAMRAAVAASPLAWLAGLAAAVVGVQAAFDAFGDSTNYARERLIEANRTHIEAAGGLGSLQDAIKEDTEAWREAQVAAGQHLDALDANTSAYSRAAQELIEYSAFRTMSAAEGIQAANDEKDAAQELERAQRGVAGALTEIGTSTSDATAGLGDVGSAAGESRGQVNSMFEANENLRQSMEDSTTSYDDARVALGLMSYEWGAAVVNSALLETSSYNSAEALREMQEAGVDMGRALALEMSEAGAGADYLNDRADELFMTMNPFEKLWSGLAYWLNKLSGGFIDLRTQTGTVVDDIRDLASATESISAAAESAVESEEILLQTTFELADGTQVAASELANMDAEALILEDTISGLGITVEQLREGFASFIDPLELWNTTQQEAQAAAENTNLSLLEMEGGFESYLTKMEEAAASQMNWAQNLLQLAADGVPAEVIAGLTEMGVQGADIVQGLVDASDEDVARFVSSWQMGGGAILDSFSIVFSEFMVQAAMAGDQGGIDFVNNLLEKVGTGEISMTEAVDRMTTYAAEEFDNADPTLEFYGDATEALEEMNTLLEEIRDAIETANAESVVEPTWSSGGFWSAITSWWSGVKDWWNRSVELNVTPNVNSGLYGSQGGGLPRKDGGWVSGPGGTRQDKIHTMLSDKEFVVNARSAREFAPLLEWINSQNGGGGAQMLAPNFVPEDIFRLPRRSLQSMRDSVPMGVSRSLSTVRRPDTRGWSMTINNHFPQAEPTSVTVNRGLAYVAALDGVD